MIESNKIDIKSTVDKTTIYSGTQTNLGVVQEVGQTTMLSPITNVGGAITSVIGTTSLTLGSISTPIVNLSSLTNSTVSSLATIFIEAPSIQLTGATTLNGFPILTQGFNNPFNQFAPFP